MGGQGRDESGGNHGQSNAGDVVHDCEPDGVGTDDEGVGVGRGEQVGDVRHEQDEEAAEVRNGKGCGWKNEPSIPVYYPAVQLYIL